MSLLAPFVLGGVLWLWSRLLKRQEDAARHTPRRCLLCPALLYWDRSLRSPVWHDRGWWRHAEGVRSPTPFDHEAIPRTPLGKGDRS
jgi:hypothetical protein